MEKTKNPKYSNSTTTRKIVIHQLKSVCRVKSGIEASMGILEHVFNKLKPKANEDE